MTVSDEPAVPLLGGGRVPVGGGFPGGGGVPTPAGGGEPGGTSMAGVAVVSRAAPAESPGTAPVSIRCRTMRYPGRIDCQKS